MRRIALAMGPVFAMLLATVPALPGHASPVASRTTSRSIGLDTASSSLGSTYVSVSWNWSRSDTAYKVQASRASDFSVINAWRKVRSSSSRPPGGRQATTLTHLHDATYYYVRVRRTGTSKSAWSMPVRVATKAAYPDPITGARAAQGADPGTVRFSWDSDGGHTDFFKITTALTPFGSSRTPAVGRNSMTFRAPGDARSLTLTPDQTQAAGAGLGSGRHLFFRITAVRSGEADSQARRYPYLRHATVTGEGPTTTGSQIRVAAYNVHVASKDVSGHLWADRAQLVADNIASHHPAVVALSEMMPSMWDDRDGGPGLDVALDRAGVGQYTLTRTTTYGSSLPGGSRILYDPTQVQMSSTCDPTTLSCAFTYNASGVDWLAAYAKFRDLASGQEFYFVSLHPTSGNDATTDALRGDEVQAVADDMSALNTEGLPVIIGGDFNSSQTSNGSDQAHGALLANGYYDTASAAQMVNLEYNSVNGYATQNPSPYGFGSMYDSVMTLNMPGAVGFQQVLTGSPWPSDHNMVFADVRLP